MYPPFQADAMSDVVLKTLKGNRGRSALATCPTSIGTCDFFGVFPSSILRHESLQAKKAGQLSWKNRSRPLMDRVS
jgi:hypothetical protein